MNKNKLNWLLFAFAVLPWIIGATVSGGQGIPSSFGWISLTEYSSMATPPSGKGFFWMKNDGTPHVTNDAGTDMALLSTLTGAASGANSDITSMSGITGGISAPTYLQLATGLSPTTPGAGKLDVYASSADKQPYAINEDGTSWGLAAPNYSTAMQPLSPLVDNTAVCSGVSDTKYAVYLGKCPKSTTSFIVRTRTTTGFVTGGAGPWAEIGIAKGTPAAGTNPSLTILGTTDVSGTFLLANTNVSTTITATAAAGDDLWIVHGSKGTTPYRCRGVLADQMGRGFVADYSTAGAISTIGANTTFTLNATASALACAVYPQ